MTFLNSFDFPDEYLTSSDSTSSSQSSQTSQDERIPPITPEMRSEWLITFDDAFLEASADGNINLHAFWRDYPERIRPTYPTACRFRKQRQVNPDYKPRSRGRPPELTEVQCLEIVKRLEELISRHGGGVITNEVIQGEALDVARTPLVGESPNSEVIFQRCKRVGGREWVNAFRRKYQFTKKRTKRPIEIGRAMKCQPEFMLLQFRHIAHIYALMQIHRVIASGVIVRGWVLNSGWVTRDRGDHVGTNTPLTHDPIITVRPAPDNPKFKVIWVNPLDCELQPPEPSEIINFDEKPLVPDSVRLVSVGQAIAYGRTNSWSVVLYLTAEGKIISYTLILRGLSVEASIAARILDAGGAVTSTPKGYQTDQTLLNDIGRLLERNQIKPSRKRPFVLLTDGHGSRLTSALLRLLAQHHIYCVIEPAHTSMFAQPLDQNAMKYLQNAYESQLHL